MKILTLLLVSFALTSQAIPSGNWWVNNIGDARVANHYDGLMPVDLRSGGMVNYPIPEGKWHDITLTFWIRLYCPTNTDFTASRYYRTPRLEYCPEAIQRNMPDALEGLGGWGVGGVNVAGSLVIPLEMTPDASYTNVSETIRTNDPNRYGAYTVNAIVTNEMGLSIGGVEHVLTSGTNSFNSYGGPSPFVTITGSGNVQVGISRMYWHQYFTRINGVIDHDEEGKEIAFLTTRSIVTNELVMVSCRMHLDETSHYMRDDMLHIEDGYPSGRMDTNSLPANPSCRAFDSRGDYAVGLIGLGTPGDHLATEIFDFRVHSWWLTDEDIQRTFYNGKEEMLRRGWSTNKGW